MTIKGDGITNARPVTSSSAKPMASLKEDELGQGGILNQPCLSTPSEKTRLFHSYAFLVLSRPPLRRNWAWQMGTVYSQNVLIEPKGLSKATVRMAGTAAS